MRANALQKRRTDSSERSGIPTRTSTLRVADNETEKKQKQKTKKERAKLHRARRKTRYFPRTALTGDDKEEARLLMLSLDSLIIKVGLKSWPKTSQVRDPVTSDFCSSVMEPDSAVEARSCLGFVSLPRLLALDIFARLPADARLLLALVSPSWRALVAEPSLWACVDLSDASGVTRASDALLLAVSAKARGGMRSLDVCGRVWEVTEHTPENERPPISLAALLTTLRSNAQSLRHLRALCPPLDTPFWQFLNGNTTTAVLDDLLHAAPGLTRVEVDLTFDEFDASLLHNGVVGVRRLCVLSPPESFPAFLADARGYSSLRELQLPMRMGAPEIEALLDFALNKPLTALVLPAAVTPAAMPSLARLVGGGRLTTLEVWYPGGDLAPSPAFCAAVAAAPLVRLYYAGAGLFDALAAGLSLLAAVTGHPTLRHLTLDGNDVAPAGRAAVGAALGLLVAAD